jgi:hypothetical protein
MDASEIRQLISLKSFLGFCGTYTKIDAWEERKR